MKKICCLLLAIIYSTLCASAAMAEATPVSIKELPASTSPRWTQTYEAHGRTIKVDVDITIPKVNEISLLRAKKAEPIAEPRISELAAQYKKADKADKTHYYDFESGSYVTLGIRHKFPVVWGTSKNKEGSDDITSQDLDLIEYDPDQAYADNNSLTVREAEEIILSQVKEILPNLEMKLDTVVLEGKTYWRKNKKPVYDRGGYWLNFRQCFHGIPSLACINDTFTDQSHTNLRDSWNTSNSGKAVCIVYDQESWSVNGCFYEEAGTILEDVPVVPFDTVQNQVEALIQSGHVRWIQSASLGYVLFDTRNPDEYLLVPCWVVWCEYHPDGPFSERKYGINDSETMFQGNNAYYRALVFDAQTGTMFDTENTSAERFLYPGLDK